MANPPTDVDTPKQIDAALVSPQIDLVSRVKQEFVDTPIRTTSYAFGIVAGVVALLIWLFGALGSSIWSVLWVLIALANVWNTIAAARELRRASRSGVPASASSTLFIAYNALLMPTFLAFAIYAVSVASNSIGGVRELIALPLDPSIIWATRISTTLHLMSIVTCSGLLAYQLTLLVRQLVQVSEVQRRANEVTERLVTIVERAVEQQTLTVAHIGVLADSVTKLAEIVCPSDHAHSRQREGMASEVKPATSTPADGAITVRRDYANT